VSSSYLCLCVSICGRTGLLRFGRLGFILDGQPLWPRHIPGRHKCPPGLPGLGFVHLGSARDGRDADQMMAGGALDLPPRGGFAAFDMLLAMGTGEFELAHKPFRVDSPTRCTTGRLGASRALQAGASCWAASSTNSDREPSRLAAVPTAPGRSDAPSALACFCALRTGTARGRIQGLCCSLGGWSPAK
jgi:hypothetical protein